MEQDVPGRSLRDGLSRADPKASALRASIPSAVAEGVDCRLAYEGDYPPVTQQQAEDAATDLIAHFFKNEPRNGGGVLIGIPARPDQDTDLLLFRFLREAGRIEGALRIKLWNEARLKGWSQDEAIRFVHDEITRIKAPPASGIAARSDETPTAAQPEARARPDAQTQSGEE